MKYDTYINEGVRDMMTPRSNEDIDRKLKDLPYKDLMNYLMDGVIDDDEERVEMVFKHIKRDFKYCKEMAETAINYGNIRIIKMFLDKGMPGDVLSYLYDYAYERQAYDISDLIKKYINMNESIRDMMTPKSKEDIILSLKKSGKLKPEDKLEYGAKNGKVSFVRQAIEKDGLEPDWNNGFALRLACIHGHANVVKYLLEMGVDRNRIYKHKKDDNWTPIRYATWFKHNDIVHLLETYFPNVKLHTMNNKIKSFFRFNESLRDKMTPISEEDKQELMSHIAEKVARELVNLNKSGLGISGIVKYDEAYDYVVSKMDMVEMLVNEYGCTDPYKIAINIQYDKKLYGYKNKTDEGLKNKKTMISHKNNYNKMIKKFDGYLNEGVKRTPDTEEEFLEQNPNFVELHSDVKQWTKTHEDVVISEIEFYIYGSVCYAYFKIIVDGVTPVQEFDKTYDKNVLMVMCNYDKNISLLLKKKFVYEWETISHYTEFTEVIKEMNKLRIVHDKSQKS